MWTGHIGRRALIGLAAAALVACSGDSEMEAAPPTARTGLPRADALAAGSYTLASAGENPLPATVARRAGCRLQIVSGSLTLTNGSFRFHSTTREVCGGEPAGRTTRAARGSYTLWGDTLRLWTSEGRAFAAAIARLPDERIRVIQIAVEGGPQAVDWLFRRAAAQPPLPSENQGPDSSAS